MIPAPDFASSSQCAGASMGRRRGLPALDVAPPQPATADDENPTLTIELAKAIPATHVMLSQAGSRATDIGLYDRIIAVELRLNRAGPIRVELDPDHLAITAVALGKTRKIRRIEVRILEREAGRQKGRAGFTEIALSR